MRGGARSLESIADGITRTVFPCYATADRDAVVSIAAYLEAGVDVRVLLEEGEIRPGEDLVRKAREGRMADVILVVFSRHSLPSPWPRSKWEGAMQTEPAAEDVRIAFLKCDDCSPPRVLIPQFDLMGLLVPALRRLKRWLRNGMCSDSVALHPELAETVETLGGAIADRPGMATVDRARTAVEFGRTFREDFDQFIRLECGGRSIAALAGDLSAQLGLRLEGDLESNLEQLRTYCSEHRFLIWPEGASSDDVAQLSLTPRSSVLVSTEHRPEVPHEPDSLRGIQYSLSHPAEIAEWSEVCRLARLGVRLAAGQGRLAECFELLQQWHALANPRADLRVLEESSREIVWILEGWGRSEEAGQWEFERAAHYSEQMSLDVPFSMPPPPQLICAVPPEAVTTKKMGRSSMPRPEQFRLF